MSSDSNIKDAQSEAFSMLSPANAFKMTEESVHDVAGAETSNYGLDIACKFKKRNCSVVVYCVTVMRSKDGVSVCKIGLPCITE